MLRVALIQQTAARDFAPNLAFLEAQIKDAAAQGARLILTPENCAMLEPDRDAHRAKALTEEAHPLPPLFSRLAQETGAFLLAGSIAVRVAGDKLANRSLLFAPDGRTAARYDKIHLFDVDLANGESYRESALIAPGNAAVTVETPLARLGLSVCYDLRFAALFRALAQVGADIITIPSAFTVPTGQAHWHVLLRARAIETGGFVLAPAQTGIHAEGRRTYGHSLIVNPWGEIIADAGTEPGLVLADLDLAEVMRARQRLPALTHDRPFTLPSSFSR
jgi:deaminated glutathione amidase